MVAQLGAMPGTGKTFCFQYFYYQFDFTAQLAGVQTFILTMNVGPVTRLPRGGTVYIWGLLQMSGPGGPWAMVNGDIPSNTGVTLVIYPNLQKGERYQLIFGVVPQIYNAGYQSYAEAIVKSATLEGYLPYGVQSAEALSFDAGENRDILTVLANLG